MTLLEMRSAAFGRGGRVLVERITLALDEGSRLARVCQDGDAASALAKLACAMLRPTAGAVFVAAFDTAIQPAQVKRLASFVPHEVLPTGFRSFESYVEYRADLAGIAHAQAVVHARSLRERLQGVHEAFALPLIGALIARPRLLVLDRPQPAYAAQILEVAQSIAVFSTHTGEADAQVFTKAVTVV